MVVLQCFSDLEMVVSSYLLISDLLDDLKTDSLVHSNSSGEGNFILTSACSASESSMTRSYDTKIALKDVGIYEGQSALSTSTP